MDNENDSVKSNEQENNQNTNADETQTSGDPGRTPTKAEGDEQVIDEDIEEKEKAGEL